MHEPTSPTRSALIVRVLVALAMAAGAYAALRWATPDSAGHGATSLIPALVAVALALATHRVITSLAIAIVVGALLAAPAYPEFIVFVGDLMGWAYDKADHLFVASAKVLVNDLMGPAIVNEDNLYVVGFALTLVAMVRVLTSTHALHRLMRPFTRLAGTRRGAQGAAAGMGCAVFFDDYANALVVGAAARPLTDAQSVSREKLSWIVDATSAPIAGLVVVSTWVAYEIKLLDESGVTNDGFDLLVSSLPYRFYCIFSVAFVWLVIAVGRDFGPMLKAERRAFHDGLVSPPSTRRAPDKAPSEPRAAAWSGWLALAAILAVIVGGLASALSVFENSLQALFFAALVSFGIAVSGAVLGKLLPARALGRELWESLGQVIPLLAILILAFSLRFVAKSLGTDQYLATLARDVPVGLLPAVSFLIAATIAFATGTSWGTMGILIPLALPLAAELTAGHPDGAILIMLVAASVLDGAIFGDHCSLISDTTLMSAAACDCPVVAHFRTQVPYTIPPMIAATVTGYLWLGLAPNTPWPLAFAGGLLLIAAPIFILGRRATDPPLAAQAR